MVKIPLISPLHYYTVLFNLLKSLGVRFGYPCIFSCFVINIYFHCAMILTCIDGMTNYEPRENIRRVKRRRLHIAGRLKLSEFFPFHGYNTT